jgi:hypothetical protein
VVFSFIGCLVIATQLILLKETGTGRKKLWILEPKAFRNFLNRQTVKLSDEDVKLASYHLSRDIRMS